MFLPNITLQYCRKREGAHVTWDKRDRFEEKKGGGRKKKLGSMSRRELMGEEYRSIERIEEKTAILKLTFINSSKLKITHKSTIGFIIH